MKSDAEQLRLGREAQALNERGWGWARIGRALGISAFYAEAYAAWAIYPTTVEDLRARDRARWFRRRDFLRLQVKDARQDLRANWARELREHEARGVPPSATEADATELARWRAAASAL